MFDNFTQFVNTLSLDNLQQPGGVIPLDESIPLSSNCKEDVENTEQRRKLTEKIEHLEAELISARSDNENLRKEIEINGLKANSSLRLADTECQTEPTDCEAVANNTIELETKHADLLSKHHMVCEKLKETIKKLAEMKQKTKSFDEEILAARNLNNEKEIKYMALQEKLNSLEKNLHLKESKIANNDSELEALKSSNSQLEFKFMNAMDETEKLKKVIETMSNEMSSMESNNIKLNAKLIDLNKSIEDEAFARSSAESSTEVVVNSLHAEIARLNEANTQLERNLVDVRGECGKLRDSVQDNEALLVQLNDYKKRANNALKQARESAKESNSSLQSNYEDLVVALRFENKTLQDKLTAFEIRNEEISISKIEKVSVAVECNINDFSNNSTSAAYEIGNFVDIERADDDNDYRNNAKPSSLPNEIAVNVNANDNSVEIKIEREEQPQVGVVMATSGQELFIVHELKQQLLSLRDDYVNRGLECDVLKDSLGKVRHFNEILTHQNDELNAAITRIRQQIFNNTDKDGMNQQVINTEYLKNCVFRYMKTSELSERKRLTPVIATLLQFSPGERNSVLEAFASLPNSSDVNGEGLSSIYKSIFG